MQFEEEPSDEAAARDFIAKFVCLLPTFQMVLNFGLFLGMIKASKHSSPGPDGIPYHAWGASLRAQVFLFQACLLWLYSGYCPVFFNCAFLWLLPKSSPEDGVYDPRDTRPLSGANSDAKIFARYIAITLDEVIQKWAFWMQRGFIRSRCMLNSVLEIETRAAKLAFNPSSEPCIVFFDFAAAFPFCLSEIPLASVRKNWSTWIFDQGNTSSLLQ